MRHGLSYRLTSLFGTSIIASLAIGIANLPPMHIAFDRVPYLGRPAPEVLSINELWIAGLTTVFVVLVSMWPLFKPRPRRVLDTIMLTQKRVVIAMLAVAAVGYFNYSYRLPRTTLMMTGAILIVALPLFMAAVRRQPPSQSRAVIIGDDPDAIRSLLDTTDVPIYGYISPDVVYEPQTEPIDPTTSRRTDGGYSVENIETLPCLGGLSQLEKILITHNVDTALLAFDRLDRDEFFGTLDICHDNGVTVLVHEDHTNHVLTDDVGGGPLLTVDLEPWDWQDHVLKRGFDIAFAGSALLGTLPAIVIIAIAIKLEDGGPILYHQERTAAFGDTFTIAKFRSMVPDAESQSGAKISEEDAGGIDPRITRVGHVLRKTHLDEIPQLWSILVGDMSVVGPRPERPELDSEIEQQVENWRQRWFVKPGLTGLAQINDATGAEPERKLRYDIEYIRRQSFWFDVKIVVRQLWKVWTDATRFALGDEQQSLSGDERSDEDAVASQQADSNTPRNDDIAEHPPAKGSDQSE